jgi:hypothetical protein
MSSPTITYLTASHQRPPAYVLVDGMPHPTAGAIASGNSARLAALGIYPHQTAPGPAPMGYTDWVLADGAYSRQPTGTAEEIATILLEQQRERLQRERTNQRLAAQTTGFTSDGHRYASDREESIPLLTAATIAAQLAMAQGAEAAAAFGAALGDGWRDTAGVGRITTATGLLALHAAFVAHGAACDRHSQALKGQIEAAISLAELDAIDLTTGWPE